MKMKTLMLVVLLVAGAACAGTGLGDAARNDITARMQTVRDPIAACYETRLKANRRLAGTVEVSVVAEAKTGQFTSVRIERDDLGDPDLNDCIVAEVKKLKLDKPTKTQLTFRYPLHFAPVK
jgi:hypothetical protein